MAMHHGSLILRCGLGFEQSLHKEVKTGSVCTFQLRSWSRFSGQLDRSRSDSEVRKVVSQIYSAEPVELAISQGLPFRDLFVPTNAFGIDRSCRLDESYRKSRNGSQFPRSPGPMMY